MTSRKAEELVVALVEAFPEGSEIVVVYQLPGYGSNVVSSLDSDQETAQGLREVARRLSPPGDA